MKLLLLDQATREVRSAALDLSAHLAFLRARRLALELRYREDQPRAPRGIPTGGQWIDDVVHVVAALRPRAPRCEGGACQNGGSFGTSGMLKIMGKTLCWDCAIKELGIQELPRDEQLKTLADFDIGLRP